MGIPQTQETDIAQLKQDKQVYDYWFSRQFGHMECEGQSERICSAIYAAVRLELSEKQRKYFTKYYFEGLTMKEIADDFGVGKATVSRTIARARSKLERVLKYVDPKLMQLFEKGDVEKRLRKNKPGEQRFKMRGRWE